MGQISHLTSYIDTAKYSSFIILSLCNNYIIISSIYKREPENNEYIWFTLRQIINHFKHRPSDSPVNSQYNQ